MNSIVYFEFNSPYCDPKGPAQFLCLLCFHVSVVPNIRFCFAPADPAWTPAFRTSVMHGAAVHRVRQGRVGVKSEEKIDVLRPCRHRVVSRSRTGGGTGGRRCTGRQVVHTADPVCFCQEGHPDTSPNLDC